MNRTPPPLAGTGAVYDPRRRGALLRSLGAHEQQIELAKYDLARTRRMLAGVVAAIEAARGVVDRIALDLDELEAGFGAEPLTRVQLERHRDASRAYARALREVEARTLIEAEARVDLQVCEQRLLHFR